MFWNEIHTFLCTNCPNTSGTTLCNYMRVNKCSMQILPCVKRCFNIHHSFFPSGFLPMSRIQTNKQVSFFPKEKNAYWLVNNCHKTQETLEQQLKRMHISKQRHTNTRKAAYPHTNDLLIRASHGPRELIAVCRICHFEFPSVLDPIAHHVHRNPNPNTNQRRRYHTSQNESVPTSKSQRSQIWDSHSFTA